MGIRKNRKAKKTKVARLTKSLSLMGAKGLRNDPFPDRYSCVLTYTEAYDMTAPLGGAFSSDTIFRVTSIYDPDYTYAGHQPYGHDQLALLYKDYLVSAMDYDITYVNPSNDGLIVMIHANQAHSMGGLLPLQVLEKPRVQTKVVSNSGSQSVNFKGTIQPWIAQAITKEQWRTDLATQSASFGFNPSSPVYFRLGVCNASPLTTATTVSVVIKLRYHTEAYNRITQAYS